MSNHTHKSAAVPFVNQKGERSMKRVKVPRYFAGKRPAYAKEEDEEEYVTDDEEEYDEENEYNSDEQQDEEDEEEDDYRVATTSKNLSFDHLGTDSDDEGGSSNKSDNLTPSPKHVQPASGSHKNEEDSEEDDPRFRRLRQIEAKTNPAHLINIHRTQQIPTRYESSDLKVVLDEDDDEEEVRQRHAVARRRKLEEPLGPQAILATSSANQRADLINEEDDEDNEEDSARQAKRLHTEDILKDLKLTGISRPVRERQKTDKDLEAESRRMKELLEQAKQEAALTSQTLRKVEDDIRREREKEALAKGDIGAREMCLVITDDEDEELAYEEWKFREIKRVQRDRAERVLLATTKAR